MLKDGINNVLGLMNKKLVTAPDPDLPCLHTINLDDLSFPFWIGNQHAKRWWMRDRLDMRAEHAFLKSALVDRCARQEGPFHVFDVGAHHGIQTVPMALWGGVNCTVHAVEANADNALVLSANVGLNRLNNVNVLHAAAGAATMKVKVSGERVTRDGTGTTLNAISVGTYCETNNIDVARIAYLKVDVEGFETEVLEGAASVLEGRPHMNIEVHGPDLVRYGSSVAKVVGLLPMDRYDVRLLRRKVDWQQTKRVATADDLPHQEIFNLLMTPLAP